MCGSTSSTDNSHYKQVSGSSQCVFETKNYRSIANLPFISKLIETILGRFTEEHLEHHDLYDYYQSDYLIGHSTETDILEKHSDIAQALEDGSIAALIMFDLSSAFNVINHTILLNRLEFFLLASMGCFYSPTDSAVGHSSQPPELKSQFRHAYGGFHF